jgi:hypothetical protein
MAKSDREMNSVRLQSSRLDEKNGEIVAHGWLDMEAIQNLRVGDYQREIMENRGGKVSSLRRGVEAGARLPDIMLGMRGEKYTSRGDDMLLENDVYIIDGLQRISALRKFATDFPDKAASIRIGAEVRFSTTRDSENDLFTVLNLQRKAMAPSVILRNKRNHHHSVATLYGLTMHDRNFALNAKVCWDQQMHRGELLTALLFGKICMTLHRHTTTGGRHITAGGDLPVTMDRAVAAVGLQTFRNNINVLFEAVDEIWGLRGIKYQDRATQTKGNFLIQFAGILSDHEDFWDGNKLVIDGDMKRKLKSFPMQDPTIIRLAGAGATAGELLRRHIIDHINKNKQTSRHLVLRRMEYYGKGKTGRVKKAS